MISRLSSSIPSLLKEEEEKGQEKLLRYAVLARFLRLELCFMCVCDDVQAHSTKI